MEQWRMLRAVIVGSALLAAACGRTGLLGGSESVGGSASAGAPSGGGGNGGVSAVGGSAVIGGSAGNAGQSGSAGAPMSLPLQIGPEQLPDARVRWDYRTTLTARGGAGAPYTFALVGGSLPAGFAVSADEGWLAGTATKVGDYPIRVQVRDVAGATATRDYVLRVAPPRFFFHSRFVSSSSTRSSLNLVDLTTPDLTSYTVADGTVSFNRFSPDGRWFAYCSHVQMGQGELFLIDTSGEKPGPPLAVLEAGQTAECAAWVWSPDGKQLAYVREGALWVADIREMGVSQRTQRVQGVSRLGLSWVAPHLIFLRNEQGRARLLRLDPSAASVISLNLEPSTLLASSPNRELAFGSSATGYFLADASNGSAEDLGSGVHWQVSPTFELLLSRSTTGDFAIYSPTQATLPVPLRVDTGAMGRVAVFGKERPALLQQENDRLVMSELRPGSIEVHPVAGAYGAPTGFELDSEDEVLVVTDRESIWLGDTTASGPLTAQLVSQPGRNAQGLGPVFDLASASRQLVVGGGDPYGVQWVDFVDPQRPLVSPIDVVLDWSEFAWSPDDTHLAILGGSTSIGRFLYLITPGRLKDPKVVVSCMGNGGGGAPRCPGSFWFQP